MHTLTIAVGTTNKPKVSAVKESFKNTACSIIEEPVPSNVSAQPMSDEETLQGAINRARACQKKQNSDIGIGLEGGVMEIGSQMYLVSWGALATKNDKIFVACGARFPIPDEVSVELKQGKELGEVMDKYTERVGVRHNEGCVGVFTHGRVSRSEMFKHIVDLLLGQYEYSRNNKSDSQ
jgi:inosine/xanthosine triphosphatase